MYKKLSWGIFYICSYKDDFFCEVSYTVVLLFVSSAKTASLQPMKTNDKHRDCPS